MTSITVIVALAFFLLLATAVFGKIDGWRAWNAALPRLVPLTGHPLKIAIIAVPTIEAAVAITVLIRPQVGLLAAGVLLTILAGSVGILSVRHAGEACSCFGTLANSRIGPQLAIRNTILAIVAFGAAAVRGAPEMRIRPALLAMGGLVVLVVWLGVEYRRLTAPSTTPS